jgi:predicted HAD superfamily Cof-like phosphohydrolase
VHSLDGNDDLLSLRACVGLVRRFHQRIRAPIAATPQTLNCDPASALMFSNRLLALSKELAAAANGTEDVLLSRAAMAIEELGEWLAANASGNMSAAADALGDRLYVVLGDAVASGLGFGLPEVFSAVHQSNWSKMPLVTTGLGKAFKGPGYRAPDLETLLAFYAARRSEDPEASQYDQLDPYATSSCRPQCSIPRLSDLPTSRRKIPGSIQRTFSTSGAWKARRVIGAFAGSKSAALPGSWPQDASSSRDVSLNSASIDWDSTTRK